MSLPNKAVGIDIGGTKMAVATVDAQGAILQRSILSTEPERGFARAVDRLAAAIDDLLARTGASPNELAGIGIGCAGPVDSRRGLINNPYTLTGWDRCDIVTPLRERFGVLVCLENDADAAAIGECSWGAGQGFDPVVMLTLGTGIGGAIVRHGQIYRGVNGEHPEIGHIPASAEGPQCYCGIRGCLESLASGNAISAAGQSAGFSDSRAVFAAAQAGHAAARVILDRAVNAAATAAWTLCHTFLPQRLILGGGIMEAHFEQFAQAMKQRLRAATQFTREAVSIVPASLGNDAGMVGAAGAAFHRVRALVPDDTNNLQLCVTPPASKQLTTSL